MNIAIYGRQFSRHFRPVAETLFNKLRNNNVVISIYKPFYEFLRDKADLDPYPEKLFSSNQDLDRQNQFMFTIGGDGTILETISVVRDTGIPVLGINSGKLGFLASISASKTDMAMDALLSGKFSLEKRSMLKIDPSAGVFGEFPYALNEFTIQKKDASMITIQAWLDRDFLSSYWADGLIISTPTGSTAYSLSVGGPLLTPDTKGLVISPIAPHNLTVRPIVIPDSNTVRLKVNSRSGDFLLSMDYRSVLVPASTEILLRKSEFDISLVRLEDQNFYTTLRNKLMWGADKRN